MLDQELSPRSDLVPDKVEPTLLERRRTSVEDLSPAEKVLDDVIVALELDDDLFLESQAVNLHAADLADLFELLGSERRKDLAQRIGPLMESEALTFLEGKVRDEVLSTFQAKVLAEVLEDLETDDAVDLIEDLGEVERQEILTAISARDRALIEGALSYPEDAAGRLMSQDFVAVPKSWTVGQAIDHIRAMDEGLPEAAHDLYIVDTGFKLSGVITLFTVLRSSRGTPLESLAKASDLHPLAPTLDQEDAAYEFRQYGLTSAPIVDDDGRLLGIVTVDDVVHVIDEEAEDDLLKLGGLSSETDFFANARQTTRARFPWLLVNLATAILASLVIGLFSDQLETIVALAILMPIVASMGGNAGTQTLTVAIRAMAMRDLTRTSALRFVGKEMLVGSLNGLLFAFIVASVAWFWFQQPWLALVIAAAMVVNMFAAAIAGALIPICLDRAGIDPAHASGVFLTTVTDVIGFLAFLGLAALLLF